MCITLNHKVLDNSVERTSFILFACDSSGGKSLEVIYSFRDIFTKKSNHNSASIFISNANVKIHLVCDGKVCSLQKNMIL